MAYRYFPGLGFSNRIFDRRGGCSPLLGYLVEYGPVITLQLNQCMIRVEWYTALACRPGLRKGLHVLMHPTIPRSSTLLQDLKLKR